MNINPKMKMRKVREEEKTNQMEIKRQRLSNYIK